MLRKLAQTCYVRRWRVVIAWIGILVGLNVLGATVGGEFLDKFTLPGSESQAAIDLLKQHGFDTRAGFGGQVAFHADRNVNDLAVRGTVDRLFTDLTSAIPGTEIVSPYAPANERQISTDGHTAYAEINFKDRNSKQYLDAGKSARALVDKIKTPGLEVALGGDVFVEQVSFSSEGIGFLAAMVILLFAFGSVLAMGLPLMTAAFGIGSGIALVSLAVNFINMPSFSDQAVAMIAIGVGIDYALFIVTRYREGLQKGLPPQGAVVRAIDTAGRAVLFAGITVIIAVMGLFMMGLAMITGMAVGISLGVLMTMLAALTLLPAVLGFVGHNIDKLGLPHRRKDHGGENSFWFRWSRVIQRRPWPALVAGLAVVVLLAIPLLSLRLGFGDAGNRPTSDTTRQAYDMLTKGFGPGFNGPLLMVAEMPGGKADLAKLQRLSSSLRSTPGVQFATDPIPNERGDAAILQAFPTTTPQDDATGKLVNRLRDLVIPEAMAGTGIDVKVGGLTAGALDFSEFTAKRLPLFIGSVLILSFLLLMTVFRSVLVPLKAVVLNLISIGAAYGVVVAVFQWGWGASLIGVGQKGPVEAWAPMMLFAILFGLSMDYEVFLLSRIREEYDRSHDNAEAVANGLATALC